MPDAYEDMNEDANEITPDALPDDTLLYTLPSRYCLPDVLGAEAWSLFGSFAPGYRRVQAICSHVHTGKGVKPLGARLRKQIDALFQAKGKQAFAYWQSPSVACPARRVSPTMTRRT